ncbi:Sterigmatocystin 8-O-methyltransferase [Penicillium angulare]|uniref:Sterigmatocystin 8-O-methyltransferase n=1 Tax=Penicillium angulare TaxID=116970 RepID=UPI002541AEAF|nr:Sterigmatocystin 8-O-methyltransferase [Penicillium angulare]KAJ5280911.1 Sterigmatocystin 8-O-methyltransferase [Penicillium angulare]
MASSRIDSLATAIAASAQELRTLLAEHDLEEPSFSMNYPTSVKFPPALDEARNNLLHAACEIHDLLLDPADLLRSYAAHANLVSLHFIQQFNIANLVPISDGAMITFAALAEQCRLPEGDVRRLLRHAMTIRVFAEPRPNEVVHTRASMLLREEGIHGWIGSTCENSWPGATRTIESLKRFPGSSDPTQSGFALANDNLALYSALAQSPERAATFAASKRGYASGSSFGPAAFLEASRSSFQSLPQGSLFVDVGGAHGTISLAAAQIYPHLHYIVQDLPEVIEQASQNPNGSPENVEFQVHDFFIPQQLRGVAVFYLRHVLHNWGDAHAINILKSLVPAMGRGTRVLIHDHVLDHRENPMWKRRQDTAMDINMLVLLNARERDEAMWRTLLRDADPRFKWVGVEKPAGSTLAVIEAVWEDFNEISE